jgi:integrase
MAIQKLGENRYRVSVDTERSPTGERKRHRLVIPGTKKNAEAYERKFMLAVATGEWREPTDDTVGTYLDKWLRDVASRRMKPASIDMTAEKIKRYVRPHLGQRRLDKLTLPDVREWHGKLLDLGLSVATVRRVHGILRSALEQAVDDRILRENPAARAGKTLPKATRPKVKALDPEQAAKFLDATLCDRHAALWLFMLETGVRPGEALALRWAEVDLKAGNVTIARSLTWRPKGDYVFTTTKTDKTRPLPLSKALVAALREHRRVQAEERLKVGPAWVDEDLVFPTETGTPHRRENLTKRHLKPILKAAGLPEDISLYALRHSCATMLMSEGINPKIVAERLGHSNVALTLNTYSHVTPTMQEKASEALGRLLFAGSQ